MSNNELETQVMVLGAGPGGYSAAFRCSDLGLDTILVERYPNLGGVCLNVGCIPSKALLHIAKIIKEASMLSKCGVEFNNPQIDINKIRIWKNRIITQLNNNLNNISKSRRVKIVNGYGKFTDTNTLQVFNKNSNTTTNIKFSHAIIATGSSSVQLPCIQHNDPRIWNSTDALQLNSVPKNLLVIGGGVIGLEISMIYHSLGSKIDIVEVSDQIIPVLDKDIAQEFTKNINNQCNIILKTEVTSIDVRKDGIYANMKNKTTAQVSTECYEAVLVAVGRAPNCELININHIGIKINESGFICVDKQMRTNISHIFAIGDVTSQPMLAHKAIHEGHIAAEVIAGKKHYFDPKVIPSIVYTEPEVSWIGLTEKEAYKKNINYEVAIFPWIALGRAAASNIKNGMTKLIFNKDTNRIIGGSIVGSNGGELLGELGLAIEMGCDAEDIALTIHAHPTFYESIGLASEIYTGSITDLPNIKR